MKKFKELIFIQIILFTGICLTGCTIQLDDEDIKTFDKIKSSTNISINGNNVSTNELISNLNTNENILYQNNITAKPTKVPVTNLYPLDTERIETSNVDLDNATSYVEIYGYNNNNINWTYRTQPAVRTENTISKLLGVYSNDCVYVLDNGILKILDFNTGEIQSEINSEFIISPEYRIDNNGTIRIVHGGESFGKFLEIDKNGNIIKKLDISSYDPLLSSINSANCSVEFLDNEVCIISDILIDDNIQQVYVTIDLNDYNIQVNKNNMCSYGIYEINNIAQEEINDDLLLRINLYSNNTFIIPRTWWLL